MNSKHICATVVAASLILIPAERAKANEGAALLGGAILGGIIVNEVHKNKQRQRTTTVRRSTRSSGISSAQRQQNRDVQTALNYFGYNVGAVDGSLGRKSRAGISRYQAEMGYTIDGYLDEHERAFLINSHQRALASAHVAPYNQILASQGQAGLLRTYRNEQLGIATPQPAQPPQVQQATAPAPLPAPAPAPQASVPARAETGALPDFTFGQTARSANEHCNQVNVLTAANGGLATAGNISQPDFALNEQFCLARIQAMAESSRIEATITNMTAEQIQQQCKGLAQAVAPQMKGIEGASAGQVISKTSGFLQNSGQPMAQLVSGGKVCLGVGYRTDDAQMALASGVLLTAAGQLGYGEVVSHHLREGFGAAKATGQQATEWMRLALNAAQNGTPVLGQTADRLAVLSAAVDGAGTGTAALPAFPAPSGN
ncbi:Putative peptidoglycan binding domain-containing protein [Cribrihabitans marinus]|uniref:Putative peptidoglycan binding domain-containing protein n=1 Tax=Cribrihabitans marinus TaxID=1227549 RepID=A0A1H6U6Q3_9RHOB|nr:peptidoglycan-binding domain-containing protein [Cribrihabitans marinus]GGH21277.1 peptidoglycan-binding protein [Cribrihabitans marinus]SEI83985.1 Putative peptidoglycan binding domain-containing protein [Cribrihabitans marinus]